MALYYRQYHSSLNHGPFCQQIQQPLTDCRGPKITQGVSSTGIVSHVDRRRKCDPLSENPTRLQTSFNTSLLSRGKNKWAVKVSILSGE